MSPQPQRPRALVLVNPAAHQGTAEARFRGLRPQLARRFELVEVRTSLDGAWKPEVARALRSGLRLFVAAGGDGTVHALVAELLAARGDDSLQDLIVGAIGLGSSNDFHKPLTTPDLPIRLDTATPHPHDVLKVLWRDNSGLEHHDVVVISASIGITAAGNARFNDPGPVLAWLKRYSTGLAIAWAAIGTVLSWSDVHAAIDVGGETLDVGLSNLSFLRTPWLSGGLHYDLDIDDGRFTVALAHDRSLLARLALLEALSRGSFVGRPGTRWWSTKRASVELDAPAALELDGEVVRATAVSLHVHPHPLRICGPGGLHA